MKVGVLWREDPLAARPNNPKNARLEPILEELRRLDAEAEPVVYSEEAEDAVRVQLSGLDGVLVWVNPIDYGRDRAHLDALLREASASGLWVSAHPDVILKMGTKDVLYETRSLGWGSDTLRYGSLDALRERLPAGLRSTPGGRVLKQHRGTGGIGVWRVELADSRPAASPRHHPYDTAGDPPMAVRVQEAQRGSRSQEMLLSDFLDRCEVYFRGDGHVIDQPFQERLAEGLIRCYLSVDRVVGFAHQAIEGLAPLPTEHLPASTPAFQRLRRVMQDGWTPAMRELLQLDNASLPVVWDADFFLGPKTPSGEDTYVLCEINVSCVSPIPAFSAGEIARNTVNAIQQRASRPRS